MPPGTTAYVYLNDSEGVVFQHSGNNTRSVTRPAGKGGRDQDCGRAGGASHG